MRKSPSYRSFTIRKKEKKTKNRLFYTIVFILIFSYVLIAWILPTLIGALGFLNKFKTVQKADTSYIEDQSIAPPVLNIPYEATNSTQIRVSGYAQPNTKVQLFIDNELQTTTAVNSDGNFFSDPIDLRLGVNNISGKTIDDKSHNSLSSKVIRVMYDNKNPTLNITSPSDNQEVHDKRIIVSGSTDPDESIKLTVNNNQLIVSSDGNFSGSIELSEGDNNLIFAALDIAGNSTQVTRKVIYRP